MRHFLSLLLLAAVVMTGLIGSACIEQTPLNLPTRDVCGIPDPGDTVSGETTDDVVPADTAADTAVDTVPDDTAEDTAVDTFADTPPDTPPDTCQPDCEDQGCGADDGCGGFCPGSCDPGFECIPELGDCMPIGCSDDEGGFVAAFPDAFLLAVVTEAVGEAVADAGLTWEQAAGITDLYAGSDATDSVITDLSGIQCLRNLEVLELSGHGLPAESLAGAMTLEKLRHLDLGGNAIADFAPFAEARFSQTLVYLKLYSNPSDVDLGPLTGFSVLEYLDLNDVLTPVGVDSLAAAAFAGSLRLLRMEGCALDAPPPVGAYTALSVLELAGNQISDLAALGGEIPLKDSLVILDLGGNVGINNLSPLAGAFTSAAPPIPASLDGWVQDWRPTLTIYGINEGKEPGLLGPIGGMEHLEVLDIRSVGLTSLAEMSLWPPYDSDQDQGMRLVDLNISYNSIDPTAEASPFVHLQTLGAKLKTLIAEGMFDEPPAGLPQFWLPAGAFQVLEDLQLGDNSLEGSNLETFSNAGNEIWGALKRLHLQDNQIQGDLGYLVPMADKAIPLEFLTLAGNQIAACGIGSADFTAKCTLEEKVQEFSAPMGCDAACPTP